MRYRNSVNVLAQDNVSKHSNANAVAENNHDWNFTVCKKIAQLTKVVYTLNCRVEDSDERTRFLTSAHKVEVEQTKADYAHKISALVEEVEQHKEQSERAIKKMEEEHQKLLQEVKSEHDAKIRQMLMEVKENKSMFETKLKQNLSKTEKENQEALNSLSASKDAEIQKLVVEYNDKYKSMLAEQLDAKDALEQQLNLEWSEKLKRIQMELGNKCNELSGELSQRTQALRGAEKEQKQLAESQQSLLRVNKELDIQMEALKRAICEKDLTIASCEQDLQNVVAEKKAQSDQLETLHRKLDEHLQEIETYKHDLMEKERYAQKLISEITAHSNTITAITTEKNAIAALNEEYLSEIEKLRNSMSQLQQQLNATSSTAAGNETAIHELQKALQVAKVNEQKLQEMLRKSEAEHALAMQSLSEAMSKQAEELQRCAEEADTAAAEEWKKKLAEMMKKYEEQTEELEERQTALRSELNKCKTELENKQTVIERLNKDVSMLNEKNDEVCESLCRAQQEIKEAQDTREQECLSLQEQLNEAIRKGKEWEEMVNVNKELSGAKNAAEMEELKRTFEAQKRELVEEHKRMCESAEKTQREKLERLELQMEKLTSNHSSELSILKSENELKMREQMSEFMRSQEMLKTKHNEELESTRKLFARRFDEAEAVWLSQRKQLEYEKEELQSRLRKTEEYAHEREAENSQSTEACHRELERMSRQLQETRECHEKELEELRLETESTFHDSLRQQEQLHATKLEELRNELEKVQLTHKEEHEMLVREHDKELAAEKDKYERAMHQTVLSMMNEKAQQLTELTNMYTDQIKSLQRTSESALQLKQAELQKANNEIASLTNTLTEKNSALTRTCEELQRVEQRHAEDAEKNAQMLSDATILHENTITSLRSEHEMQIRKLGEIHQRIVDDLNVQMQQSQLSHAANEAELRAALKLLQHKYDYRESRSEDVELINTLRTQVKEAQRALEKAYEDMKLYKLELINREENYNKLFSRTPLVAARAQSLQQSMPELFTKNKANTTAAPAMTPTHDKSNSLPMLRKSTIHNTSNIVK